MGHKGAVALTLIVSALGGFLFNLIGAPAAYLTGGAFAVTGLVLLGVRAELPSLLRSGAFALLGIIMGTGVSGEAIEDLPGLPIAIVGLAVAIAGATIASYYTLRRLGRWDPVTALCGSIPGAFAVVLAVSLEKGAVMERVVIAQALRLFVLVALVPFALGGASTGSLGIAAGDHSLLDVVLTVAVAFVSAYIAVKVRLPAAPMLGPLIVSAVISTTGVMTIALPGWLSGLAFALLGASVAVRFGGLKRGEFWGLLTVSMAAFATAFAAAMTVAVAVTFLVHESFGSVLIAYSPGGVDAMVALSFLLGFDVAFVALLHVVRVTGLSIVAPIIVGRLHRAVNKGDHSQP
ncbi:MAG: AbrB family transcriptional regulator [Devosia sp.]